MAADGGGGGAGRGAATAGAAQMMMRKRSMASAAAAATHALRLAQIERPPPSPPPTLHILPLLPHVASAAFFDLLEDGVWDILAASERHTAGMEAAGRRHR